MGSSNTSTCAEITENCDIHVSNDSPPYAEGERVFAYHATRLYEAKVSQVEYKHNQWSFFVHYLGWKKCWDEWVGMDRLMKLTDENIHKKLELDEKLGTDKNTKIRRASLPKSKTSNVARGRKRNNESIIEEKSGVIPYKLVNIQLVKLPRTPNVKDILKKYSDHKLKKCGMNANSVEVIMKGLCCYFDKALPVMLLYKNEHQQYQEACPDDIFPSTIYGAEHLLRLFVKLPELMFHVRIEEETLIEIQAELFDFLRFLQRNQRTFFLSTYHVPEDIENDNNKQVD